VNDSDKKVGKKAILGRKSGQAKNEISTVELGKCDFGTKKLPHLCKDFIFLT
jgi:hypothetical protein